MALPGGVTAATVTWSTPTDSLGNLGSWVRVRLVSDRAITWTATGTTLYKQPVDITPAPHSPISTPVPHVDQSGFVDGSGGAITGWMYTVTAIARFRNGTHKTFTKNFQVLTGQGTIDLGGITDEPATAPVTAPAAVVTSIGGKTGAIAAEDIADLAFDPNDVGYDIIVIAGQSNASGYGEGYDARLDPTHPRIWQLASSGTLIGQVCIAQDPLFHHAQAPAGRIGFTQTLARMFADRVKPNRRILLVPVAHGGSGMRPQGSGVWDPAYAGGFDHLYSHAVMRIQQALTQKIGTQTAPNNRIIGVFWHQGETDSSDSTNANLYQTRFDAMVTAFRTDVPQLATAPFVVGQMVPETIPTTNYESIVNAVHVDTPRRFTYTGFAYGPLGYSQVKAGEDSVHYSGAGQRVLAPILFDAWLRAQTNVTGTAPNAPVSVTVAQNGATGAVVSWPQPDGRVTDFEVQYSVNAGSFTAATRTSPLIDVTQPITGLTNGNIVTARVRTINEQGTSAWTTSAPLTIVPVPGQVTGVTIGTPASTSLPVSWTAVTGATAYLVEYKKHTDSVWLTATTTATLSTTITLLASSTSYDVRVTATNGAGTGTASTTATATTAAPLTLTEDVGATPQVAYSVARRVVSGYTGPLFKARRSSDNAELDFSCATGTNDVDYTALATWASTSSVFVKTIYDQSGNGWDFTQTTTASQPQIVNAGSNNTEGGKLCMIFDGVDDGYLDTTTARLTFVTNGGVCTLAAVIRPQTGKTGATGPVMGEVDATAGNSSATASLMSCAGTAAPIKPMAYVRADAAVIAANNQQPNTDTSDQLRNRWTVSDGATTRSDIDATVQTTLANSFNLGDPGLAITLTQRHLGGFGTSLRYKGKLSEIVRWPSVLTETQIAAGKTNQRSFYGTP